MTKKETVELLKKYRESGTKIETREKELEDWENRYRKDLSFKVLMPMSLIMYKIKAEVEQATRNREAALEAIGILKDDNMRMVMEQRYLAGKSFNKIAERMGYSVSYVFELHRKGLIEISKKLHSF